MSNCQIREHTGDDHYVRDGVCPRHGYLEDYPTMDDREVDPRDRRFPETIHERMVKKAKRSPWYWFYYYWTVWQMRRFGR